jgi:S1-C subfamily serine protease
VSSPPVSLQRACADGFGRLRCFRARSVPAGFLVLAASALFLATQPAAAQYPIRQVPQSWGPHAPVLPGRGAAIGVQGSAAGGQQPGGTSPGTGTGEQAAPPLVATPHPAVARIVVPEKDGVSYGSGTLVDARGQFGLVVTNWHVVRDAAGPIEVEFPGGFKSPAEVVKTDKDWDLAALSVYRPPSSPVPVTAAAPQPGEWLTIAGYGGGDWRVAGGQCTQYLAPGLDFPHEMVELATEARQGDSGGPIFNQQGELAGVLFGSGPGYTSGSYGGRVLKFLATVVPGGTPGVDDSAASMAIAANGSSSGYSPGGTTLGLPPPPQATALYDRSRGPGDARQQVESDGLLAVRGREHDRLLDPPPRSDFSERFGPVGDGYADEIDSRAAVVPDRLAAVSLAPPSTAARAGPQANAGLDGGPTLHGQLPPRIGAGVPASDLHTATPAELLAAAWRQMGGTTLIDQTKSVLALIGGLSLLVFFWRLGGHRDPHGDEA